MADLVPDTDAWWLNEHQKLVVNVLDWISYGKSETAIRVITEFQARWKAHTERSPAAVPVHHCIPNVVTPTCAFCSQQDYCRGQGNCQYFGSMLRQPDGRYTYAEPNPTSTQCQHERMALGLQYPRTCPICGLGPCQRHHVVFDR